MIHPPQVWTAGKGTSGALGHGGRTDEWLFRVVNSLVHIHVVRASAGSLHSAVVTSDGKLYTWGTGIYGRLGHGGGEYEWYPRLVASLADAEKHAVDVACGRAHTAVIVYDLWFVHCHTHARTTKQNP